MSGGLTKDLREESRVRLRRPYQYEGDRRCSSKACHASKAMPRAKKAIRTNHPTERPSNVKTSRGQEFCPFVAIVKGYYNGPSCDQRP